MLLDQQSALPTSGADDVTVRQLVRVSIGGSRVRVRLSNAFGTSPLKISSVNIARASSPGSPRIDRFTDHQARFAGARSVTIPPGAEYVSDPVDMSVPALATLTVSIRFLQLPKLQTGHPGSRATTYVVPGDQLSTAGPAGGTTVDHWYNLSEIDVEPTRPSRAIAVLGDSITDGHGVESNSNRRWTDVLAERLKGSPATRSLAVLNLGIGGNRILDDGIGPNAVARFERDVLARPGVRYLVILEGVNDLGMLTRDAPVDRAEHEGFVRRLLTAYEQMVARARERGIKVIAGTIMPYGGSGYYHPVAANEADRRTINDWIRMPGHVDAVVDFDALMRDPADPARLKAEFDSGDGLHPSLAGYRFMGEAVPIALFRPSP